MIYNNVNKTHRHACQKVYQHKCQDLDFQVSIIMTSIKYLYHEHLLTQSLSLPLKLKSLLAVPVVLVRVKFLPFISYLQGLRKVLSMREVENFSKKKLLKGAAECSAVKSESLVSLKQSRILTDAQPQPDFLSGLTIFLQ